MCQEFVQYPVKKAQHPEFTLPNVARFAGREFHVLPIASLLLSSVFWFKLGAGADSVIEADLFVTTLLVTLPLTFPGNALGDEGPLSRRGLPLLSGNFLEPKAYTKWNVCISMSA